MELGALGEFFGSVAVVVTLAFLSLQVRQSNRLAIASELASLTNHRIQLLDAGATSRDLAEVLAFSSRWPGGDQLSRR